MPAWVTSEVVAEAEQVLHERLRSLAMTDDAELRRRLGRTIATESTRPSGRLYADEAVYVKEGNGVRVFVEVFAARPHEDWSRALARGEHFPESHA
jgi:catechol-2,3-dioxygenase